MRGCWHGKAARTITEHFPELNLARPEVLAHHWTQAAEMELVPRWPFGPPPTRRTVAASWTEEFVPPSRMLERTKRLPSASTAQRQKRPLKLVSLLSMVARMMTTDREH